MAWKGEKNKGSGNLADLRYFRGIDAAADGYRTPNVWDTGPLIFAWSPKHFLTYFMVR